MARPVKWSRDLHLLREKAGHSRTETWSRQDIERLFGVSRPSAQNLMKAIGNVETVGAAHFVSRASLLGFLDAMIGADSVEGALQARMAVAAPAPRPKALRVSLPDDLRHAMLPDLPANVSLAPGRIEITADSAEGMVGALFTLALVMQNDLDRWRQAVSKPTQTDRELELWLSSLRAQQDSQTKHKSS